MRGPIRRAAIKHRVALPRSENDDILVNGSSRWDRGEGTEAESKDIM